MGEYAHRGAGADVPKAGDKKGRVLCFAPFGFFAG